MVSVIDTGDGMDAETLARVFEPFFTTKDVGKGAGLGLSQVYGFVESCGGFVDIQSEPGEGAIVALHLPRTAQALPEAEPRLQVAAPLTSPHRILVVEDDGDVIGAAAETLKDAGFDVLTAATGAEALSLLSSEAEVDLLFTDVMMPGGMDGVRLAEAGRQVRPGLKVLLTSGYAEPLGQGQGGLCGLPILAKPYRRDELLGRLQALMGGAA